MKGQAFADRRPVSLHEGFDVIGSERRRSGFARLAHGGVGGRRPVAPRRRPGLVVDLDQGLEFAPMMGVAQRVLDLGERAVRRESVMHDDAALQVQGDRAALFLGPIVK